MARCPVEEFLDSLSKHARAKAIFVIDILRMKGNQVREPYAKKIRGVEKLFELRFRYGGNEYRIFYSPIVGRKFILLHGFPKKTEKTPNNEIQRAVHYMSDYLQRKGTDYGT